MRNGLLLISYVLLLSSCISRHKLNAAKTTLDSLKEQHRTETAQIATINSQATGKLNEGKIDSNIDKVISQRIARLKSTADSAQTQINLLDSLMKDKRTARQNYKKIVLPALDSLQHIRNAYAERLNIYLMVQDGLSIADFKLFDLAAFFGPGKYIIPDDKVDLASQSFSPIIDSLIIFSNKYSHVPRTATLVILGFADGLGISPGTELYDTLITQIGKPNAARQELNQKLSELRARELIRQLTNSFFKKASQFQEYDKMHVDYLGQGKGETYPLPTIKDYHEDDERRRIVLCYWVVLPD